MTSIGDTLRRQRQRRNLEISTIAGELKISGRFLEAIEQDDLAKLPGGVFTKSFVRQYAGYLGLDADELLAEMEQAAEREPLVSQLSDKPKPNVPVMDLDGGENWQSISDRRTSLPSWVRAGVLLVALMLVCSGVYWWWQRPRHQALAHEVQSPLKAIQAPQSAPPVSAPVENPPASPPAPAVAPPPVTQASAEQPTPPAATPAVPVPASNPNATVRVGITADEQVWIRAEANGKVQFEGVLQPHESRNIDADGEVRVRLGNAGGATLTLNGKPVGAVGPKGQIRTVQFTSGGFQIVSPPKPPDPLDRL
jgi:cytoskeletal protein RodZ